MDNINEELDMFKSIIKCIANQFGDKCEVVLHDFSKDYDNSILAIENGHVTGRTKGSSITNLGLEFIKKEGQQEGTYNYLNETKDGKVLRSSSSIIRNNEGKPIGTICINYDITDFIMAENLLKKVTLSNNKKKNDEIFVKDVNDLLEYYLKECVEEIGKPPGLMSKEEKIKAIKILDDKGVFLITKSGNKVCELFNISKFTLYNYLDEIRD